MLQTDFTEEGPLKLDSFLKQYRPNFPVGICPRDPAMAFLQIPVMMPGYVPKLAFIDRQGAIRAQYDGAEPFFREEEKNIRAMIEELLKAPARPARAARPAARKTK